MRGLNVAEVKQTAGASFKEPWMFIDGGDYSPEPVTVPVPQAPEPAPPVPLFVE